MRTLQDQYHDQSSYDTFIRELALNRETIRLCSLAGLDIEAAYRERFGLTYSEMAFISFATYATVMGDNSTGALDRTTWFTNPDERLQIRDGAVDAFFSTASLNIAAFQSEARNPRLVPSGIETLAASPLRWVPLVERANGTCVAPVARDLLERPTRNFVVDAIRATEPVIGVLNDIAGRVYESYVRESLASVVPEVHNGSDVLPSSALNCDFILEEADGLVLVEAKSIHLSIDADISKDPKALRRELQAKGVGHGLAQLDESARQIREGNSTLGSDLAVVGLLVVRGEGVLLNWPFIRTTLADIAKEELGRTPTVEYQVANDESFTTLVRIRSREPSLFAIVHGKASASPYEAAADMHTLLGDGRWTNLPVNPIREKHFESFNQLLAQFGVTDLPTPGLAETQLQPL